MDIGKEIKEKAWVLLKSSLANTPVSASVNGLVFNTAAISIFQPITTIMSWT